MKKLSLLKVSMIPLIIGSLLSCQPKNKDKSIVRSSKYKESLIESYKKVGLFCTSNMIPGLTVAVSIDNQLVWADGFGYSNYELKVNASPEHKFRAGQISELFTTLTVAKLYEEGKLQLDKPVAEFLPEMNKKSADFTIQQLGAHCAGIEVEREQAGRSQNNSLDKIVSSFINDSLDYMPEYYYSHTELGFDLIGYIIEKTTNTRFDKVEKALVFDTLKLDGTVPDLVFRIIDKRSSNYEYDYISQPVVASQIDLRGKEASAGYLSTVLDLIKVGNTLLTSGFLKQETIDLITTPYKLKDGKDSQYGFGLIISRDMENRVFFGQRGSVVGGSAMLLIYPEDKMVIAMMANSNNNTGELPVFDIAEIFRNQLHPELKEKKKDEKTADAETK